MILLYEPFNAIIITVFVFYYIFTGGRGTGNRIHVIQIFKTGIDPLQAPTLHENADYLFL